MNKYKPFFFVILLSASLQLNAQSNLKAGSLSGTVTSIDTRSDGEKVVNFRTANENLILDLKKLPSAIQARMNDPKSKTQIQKYDVGNVDAVLSKVAVPMGIRSDCSELPISASQIQDIAKNSSNMEDFLKKIPKGTLQSFTFVPNTLSLHKGRAENSKAPNTVNSDWPRVLRGSIDGKMTISFVCDPKNETYGRVEIMTFDDATNEVKSLELDFGHDSRPVKPANRIHMNPEQCKSCHTSSLKQNGEPHLKLNWPEYFTWGDCDRKRGIAFYGSSDDNMGDSNRMRGATSSQKVPEGCNYQTDLVAFEQEKKDYQNFRSKQADNACFNTLPWPEGSPESLSNQDKSKDYSVYPYSKLSQATNDKGLSNYSLRTNTRFTDVYSHLTSKRNFQIVKDSPEYNAAKYFIAMEEVGCMTEADRNRMKEVLPNFDPKPTQGTERVNFDSYDVRAKNPILYNYSKRIGMNDADWSMEFKSEKLQNDPSYNTAIQRENGTHALIPNVTASEVLREIASTNPKVDSMTKGIYEKGTRVIFGEAFSCIDDLGQAVKNKARNSNDPICNVLREENEINLKTEGKICTECSSGPLNPLSKKIADSAALMEQIKQNLTLDSIEKGKKLIQITGRGKCVMCHANQVQMLPTDFRFMPADNDPNREASIAVLKARMKEGDLLSRVHTRLINNKSMPPAGIADDLTDVERGNIRDYLVSVGTDTTPNK